jgi:phosphate transport system permease protein
MPIVGTLFYAQVPSGVGVLTAGIILAIMIVPKSGAKMNRPHMP